MPPDPRLTTDARGELPHATAKSLRILGKIRQRPEDFRVDEVPAYGPEGRGDHLLIRLEKTSLDTPEAVRRVAAALGCDPRDAGWAGLKDRHAVTTQWISLRGASAERARALSLPGLRVLEAAPHGRKLRTGHLRGNRFTLLFRCDPEAADTARAILESLDGEGLPNFYGAQRFGRDGRNLERAGAWLLDGGRPPRDRFQRKLLCSTLQAALFNDWLARRMATGAFRRPLPGDLMRKSDTGGLFVDLDDTTLARRMADWEISPTGPIYGAEMRWPEAQARVLEERVLQDWGLTEETLASFKRWGAGSRRVARVRPGDWSVTPAAEGLWLRFELPAGAYATVLVRELTKADPEPPSAATTP